MENRLRFVRQEPDTNAKRKHNRVKLDTSTQGSLHGTLSKVNEAITSDLSLPNSDPPNIDHLHSKHPEPAHPDRDPVCVSSILWPWSDTLQDYRTTSPVLIL